MRLEWIDETVDGKDVTLDLDDVNVRFAAWREVRELHQDCAPDDITEHIQLMIFGADLLYRWLADGSEELSAPPVAFEITVGPPVEEDDPTPSEEGVVQPMCIMTDTQKVVLSVQALDAEGHPTDLPGDLAWSSSDESVVTVEVSADNPGEVTIHAGAPGIATVEVSGGGMQGAEAFTITSGPATAIGITVGNPVEDDNSPGAPVVTPPADGGETTPPVETGGETTPPVDTPPVDTTPAPPVDGGDTGSGTPAPEEGGPETGTDTPPVQTGGDEPVVGEPGAETPVPQDPTPVGEGTGLEGGAGGSGDTGSDDQPLPPVS